MKKEDIEQVKKYLQRLSLVSVADHVDFVREQAKKALDLLKTPEERKIEMVQTVFEQIKKNIENGEVREISIDCEKAIHPVHSSSGWAEYASSGGRTITIHINGGA